MASGSGRFLTVASYGADWLQSQADAYHRDALCRSSGVLATAAYRLYRDIRINWLAGEALSIDDVWVLARAQCTGDLLVADSTGGLNAPLLTDNAIPVRGCFGVCDQSCPLGLYRSRRQTPRNPVAAQRG